MRLGLGLVGGARDSYFLVGILYLAALCPGSQPNPHHYGGHPPPQDPDNTKIPPGNYKHTHGQRRNMNELQGRTGYKVTSTQGGFLRIAGVGDSWCDVTLGCIYVTDDWYSKAPYGGSFKVAFRALNFLPETRAKINTRFYLHTRETNTNQEIRMYESTSLVNSTFKYYRPTKLIIHGHLDSGRKEWVEAMASSLLLYGDFNVFRVDWGGGSQTVFSQALANTRVVGLEVAHLVNWLADKFQVDTRTVHIIGHSLGAHIAGYAGEQIRDLGRISGLDPAGTGFNTMPDMVHLDPSDALFVDVIHSNAGYFALGTQELMGHLDFFPNGGKHQPGCNILTKLYQLLVISWGGDMLHGLRQLFACSHDKSIDFYMDSLHKPYDYVGHECRDYSSYLKGGCSNCGDTNEKCAPMGIAADTYYLKHKRKYVKMYLNT